MAVKTGDILNFYRKDARFVSFADRLKLAGPGYFRVKGLAGSQLAFLVAAAYRNAQRNLMVILNDKEEALYFQNDLQALMPKKEIYLFPASYKRPYQIEEVDNANILQRAEVLNEINHTKTGRRIIITFAEAMNEKVVNRRSLVKNTLEIKEGGEYGMEFLIEVLEDYGFEREDFVVSPGQFAVRGGFWMSFLLHMICPTGSSFLERKSKRSECSIPFHRLRKRKSEKFH